MNILLNFIFKLNFKLSLLYNDILNSSSVMFYINNVFKNFLSFNTLRNEVLNRDITSEK